MNCIFGIDVGGTEVKIGKFYGEQLVLKTSIKTDTSDKGKNILSDIFKKINELTGDDTLVGIGLGVPGPVVDGVINGAQNLGWGRIEAVKVIKEIYPNIEVKVLNDANAAAIGEMAAGGATNYRNFVFMTLGTGVGGGVVVDGNLIEGKTGAAGEIGHIRVGYDNERKCNCGLYDCVETYASATGLVKTANKLKTLRDTKLNEVEVSSRNIFDLAKQGDEVALEAVDVMVEKLSILLSSLANTLNPEAFVIGGGVSKAGSFLLNRLEKKFKEISFYAVNDTEFSLATLGNDAGIYGTSYVVRKKIDASK